MYPTPRRDALEAALGGSVLATWNARTRKGGEWDALRAVPVRRRRRLQGAGWLRRDGMAPDQLGDVVRRYGPPGAAQWSDCEVVAWYVREALAAIEEGRRASHYDRHLAYAKRQGARTYYDLRDTRAVLDGYPSLWAMRKARGWT